MGDYRSSKKSVTDAGQNGDIVGLLAYLKNKTEYLFLRGVFIVNYPKEQILYGINIFSQMYGRINLQRVNIENIYLCKE